MKNEQRFIVDSENVGKNIEGSFLSPHAALQAAAKSFGMLSRAYSDQCRHLKIKVRISSNSYEFGDKPL